MTTETDPRPALRQAAEAARYAPSVHNTQPWKWIVYADRLELHAATERQLAILDPAAHLLLISCGAALHHARIALEAAGWQHRLERPAGTPLAVIHPERHTSPALEAIRRFEQLSIRHTDRRTVSDTPIAASVLDTLVASATHHGNRLHVLGRNQVIDLAVAVEHAQKAEAADERLQQETAAWVGGDRTDGTGIPAANLPTETPLTTVAERDFGAAGSLSAGTGHDTAATYAVLYGDGDEPADWLRAGESLTELWLAATEHAVSLLPISSPVEVPYTHHELRRIIGGLGNPYLVVRLGTMDVDHRGPGATPRLPVEQVIEQPE
jgi:nitroreductase